MDNQNTKDKKEDNIDEDALLDGALDEMENQDQEKLNLTNDEKDDDGNHKMHISLKHFFIP